MEAYGISMTGEGLTYQERLCLRVRYPKCDMDLTEGYLATHWQVQNGVSRGYLRETPPRCNQEILYILPLSST